MVIDMEISKHRPSSNTKKAKWLSLPLWVFLISLFILRKGVVWPRLSFNSWFSYLLISRTEIPDALHRPKFCLNPRGTPTIVCMMWVLPISPALATPSIHQVDENIPPKSGADPPDLPSRDTLTAAGHFRPLLSMLVLSQQDSQSCTGLLLQWRVYFLPQRQILKEQALGGGARSYLNMMCLAMFEPMGGLLLSEWRQRSGWMKRKVDGSQREGTGRDKGGKTVVSYVKKKSGC